MELLELMLPPCLERWEDGSIRVAGHRVLLSQILEFVYGDGGLDELRDRFPSLPEEKLHSVWMFCQEQPERLREYYEEARREADRVRLASEQVGPTREELYERMRHRKGERKPD